MGRLRYIEPELWQNAELRRLGWVGRQVFIFLFSSWADDEGRFKWDPLAILATAFSRSDPTDENGVGEALDGLAATGMLLRYGKVGEFGFILAWFLHQSMDKRYRRQSALPPPPVPVPSWAAADETRIAYAKHTEAKDQRQVTYRESIRWSAGNAAQQPRKSRATPARVPRESPGIPALEGVVEGEVVVEGVNNNDQDLAPPADAEAALVEVEPEKTDKPGPASTALAQLVQDTWEALGFSGSPPSKKPAAFSGALRLMDGKTNLVRNELIPWINRNDPSPGDGDTDAGFFIAFLTEMFKCTPGVGWRKQSGDGPSAEHLRGWPARLTEPDMTFRPTTEQIEAMARSPDWEKFPHLDRYMVAPAAEKIKAARRKFEESQRGPV